MLQAVAPTKRFDKTIKSCCSTLHAAVFPNLSLFLFIESNGRSFACSCSCSSSHSTAMLRSCAHDDGRGYSSMMGAAISALLGGLLQPHSLCRPKKKNLLATRRRIRDLEEIILSSLNTPNCIFKYFL